MPPKVFISYSHDTLAHQVRVLNLADRLRADGIDAEIDQYNIAPPEGWPLWCEQQIKIASFVLMVCTESYHRRVSGDEVCGKGLGAIWEVGIIRQLLYDAGAVSNKFVPVLFSDGRVEHIPTLIRGRTRYVVDTKDGYERLLRQLSGQPDIVRPVLGSMRPLPARQHQWSADGRPQASALPAGRTVTASIFLREQMGSDTRHRLNGLMSKYSFWLYLVSLAFGGFVWYMLSVVGETVDACNQTTSGPASPAICQSSVGSLQIRD